MNSTRSELRTCISGGGKVNKKKMTWFGEKGKEYVVPSWMLQNPAIVNIAGILEGIRTNGFVGGTITSDRWKNC